MAATMNADDFRRIALGLPDAVEGEHMAHPDFRIRKPGGLGKGKIFATLDAPEKGWGMVKLTPQQQRRLLKSHPGIFKPASGAWGAAGATHVRLGRGGVNKKTLLAALLMAWCNTAPKKMVEELGNEPRKP